MDRSGAEGALIEAPKTPRGVGFLFDLKIVHFCAVSKLDLTEKTRMQLQEEETIASSCLILAASMILLASQRSAFCGLPFCVIMNISIANLGWLELAGINSN